MPSNKSLAPLALIAALLGGCATGLDTPGGGSVSASAYNRGMAEQGHAYYCKDGACDTAPKLIRATAPRYPAAALDEGREGWASVVFDIEANGEISNARLASASAPEFGEAAMSAIHTWKFKPARLKGKPVRIAAVQQPLPFKLADEE